MATVVDVDTQSGNTQGKQFNRQALIDGLRPVVEGFNTVGILYQIRLGDLGEKLANLLQNSTGIDEIDNVIFTPHMANTSVGIDSLRVTAFFITGDGRNGNPNIWYRGKGAKQQDGERINLASMAGGLDDGSGCGQFGLSNLFKDKFKPFVKRNNNGVPLFEVKSVPGHGTRVASLELDYNVMLMLALGINTSDAYTYDVIAVNPVKNDYILSIMKRILDNNIKKGRKGNINYARIQSGLYQQVNGNDRGY